MSEFMRWIKDKPRNAAGKVDVRLLIEESESRGYCVCPKPMRQLIDISGLTCSWCKQKETKKSWEFYYKEEFN